MPQDTKLKVVAHRTKQPMASVLSVWVCLLDMASQHNPRGSVVIDAEQIAVLQNLETEDVVKIINAFYEKNLLTPENRLTNWDKRQYTTSTDRMKKHRDTKKRDVTRSDVVKREKVEKQTDTEYREQNADSEVRSEGRSAEARVEAEKETNSDKKLQTHTEKREREREKQKIGGQATDQKQSENHGHNQILQQMLDIWNEEVQSKLTKGQKAILTPKRKEQMTYRWLEDFQQDMRAWRYYCEIIGASNFCLGKREGKEGKAWTIDLGWAIASSDNVARIMEGGFSGGNHPPKPPACDVPALQQPWDTVLAYLAQKHGKSCIRSWFAATIITRMLRYGDGAVVVIRCPNQFIQEWISQRYLADLNQRWMEVTVNDARVIRIELTVEG